MTVIIRPEDMDPPAIPDGDPFNPSPHDARVPIMQAIEKIRLAQLDSPSRAIPELHLNGVYGVRPPAGGFNLTGLPGLKIRAPWGGPLPGANPSVNCGGMLRILPGSPALNTVFDLTGSQYVDIEGLGINADAASTLKSIMLLARSGSPITRESTAISLRRCTLSGPASASLIYCHGVEYITLEDCELTLNGPVGSTSCLHLGTMNLKGHQSDYLAVIPGYVNQVTSARIVGGRMQNASQGNPSTGADQHCVILDGAQVVSFRDVTFNAAESIARIMGDIETRSVLFDACRFLGAPRNVIRQQTPVPPRNIVLRDCETDAREAIYQQLGCSTSVAGFKADNVLIVGSAAPTTFAA